MSLPDHLFGTRWAVGIEQAVEGVSYGFAICDAPLPDVCVLWEMYMCQQRVVGSMMYHRPLLNDQVATTNAQCNGLQAIIPQTENQAGEKGWILASLENVSVITRLKMLVKPQGRRLMMEWYNGGASEKDVQTILVFSSIPSEVPDCYT